MIVNDFDIIIFEHFDLKDSQTRKDIMGIMNEETVKGKVLSSLTSKLYDAIVDKVGDIDFGTIPSSKGDITEIEDYDKLIGCINLLVDILAEYKQHSNALETINIAIENVKKRKEMYEKAFRYNVEFPMVSYCSTVLSIVSGVSLLISTSIEFIKEPSAEKFDIELNKVGLAKTKDALLFKNLESFNKSCANGTYDKSMDLAISINVKKLTGVDDVAIVGAVVAFSAIIINILPVLRELVYFHYKARVSISDYFEVQSELLRMNAYKVKDDATIGKSTREDIFKKQIKIADVFKKISNKIALTNKKSEVEAKREIEASKKKLKSSDLVDRDEEGHTSSLF